MLGISFALFLLPIALYILIFSVGLLRRAKDLLLFWEVLSGNIVFYCMIQFIYFWIYFYHITLCFHLFSFFFFKVSSFFLSCQNNLLTEWFFLFHFSFNAVSQALLWHFGPDCWRVWAVLCIARCFTATLVSAHPSNWNDQKCFQTSSNVPPGVKIAPFPSRKPLL